MSVRAHRLWGVVGVIAALGVLFALGVLLWPAPSVQAVAIQPSPELVARGRYVATAADCVACHTTEGGQPYAGGRAFKLPFGTIYAPNITPDRQTGIGAWTAGEFLRAVRQGVGRQGEELYPAFPYTSYHRMTDQDVLAVKAYLATLAPVRHETPRNALAFPFNQRPLMRFWKLLFMPRQGFHADSGKPADWNRGAYLVTALGHCGECHTPRNLLYGPSGRALSGETMQGWTAWNITSDPHHGVGAWSTDEIAAYLRYGYAPGRGVASGPMKEAVDYSLSQLTPQDLTAIAVYLKSTPASDSGPAVAPANAPAARAPPTGPADVGPADRGRRIFEGACASCHAWNGEGQQTPIAALSGRRSVYDPHARNVMQTVLRGGRVAAPQGQAFMPAFGAAYSDAEIAAVSNYVVSHFGGQTGRAAPRDVTRARSE